MFCSNCGAKVDDNARFCPVCGNKLDKNPIEKDIETSEEDNLIGRSTYQSLNTNENLIKNQEDSNKDNSEVKSNKFKEMFSVFKSKNKTAEEETVQNEKAFEETSIDSESDQSEFRNNTPEESLEQRVEFEEEIPPAYYGYNPTDDRKSKDKRRKNTGEVNSFESREVLSQRSFESSKEAVSSNNQSLANSHNIHDNSSVKNSPTIDDIPSEYVEARIANLLKKSSEDSDKKAASSGNLAALIRSNQSQNDAYQKTYAQNNTYQETYNQNNIQSIPENKAYEPSIKESQEVKSDKEEIDNKQGFKFKPIYLLPILLLALAIVIGYFFMNRKPKDVEIDLSNYIDVTYTGDNASASPNASLDTTKLLNDFASQIQYINKDRKNDQYGSAANQFVEELASATTFQFSKDSNLSNGEEITVVANVSDPSLADDYNVLFASTMKSVIVDGLNVEEYIDPFNYIDINFQGDDPNISLTTNLTEDAPEYMSQLEIMPSKTSELKAGEEVNITINLNEEEIFNNYKVRLSPLDKTITVPGESSDQKDEEEDKESSESSDGYIASVDNLSEDLLNILKTNSGTLIKETFNERTFTQIESMNYLGAITGTDSNSEDLKNRVMLVYEIKANEDYEGLYKNQYTYYSFVEYQNVKGEKDQDGKFYSQGPLTTDNEIFHKFFVADDYTYYEIPYYGFGFLEEVIARINNSLSGLTIDDSIAVDQSNYFTKTDGVANEYQGNDTRLSLREDGTLKYQKDNRVHQGSWQENGNEISLTIQGVNVDTPINATFENGTLNVSEQGEMSGQTFNKMQAF
ncbi:zinc ribbon domain-containing protein [Anaerococcus provencensis]|uniref:zinc ribbon domain-containing protein n=1 Tax=Anaerococcus provencensis TaxID=938293 RepID=UPI00030EDDBE|nr:zinc ribbon domain-containing protein [Anaerococcus provencensis]